MSDTRHVTVQLGLAQQLNELAVAVRVLRERLGEKEKTIQLQQDLIVTLQRNLAKTRGEQVGE